MLCRREIEICRDAECRVLTAQIKYFDRINRINRITKRMGVMEKSKGKLFLKPVGGSEHTWNNSHFGTTGPVTCEGCGTEHNELDISASSRIIDQLLGVQIVEECCGKAIDMLYNEFGEEFFEKFLAEYAENPLSPRFAFVGATINNALGQVNKKALELATNTVV